MDYFVKRGIFPKYFEQIRQGNFERTKLIEFVDTLGENSFVVLNGKPAIGKTFAIHYLFFKEFEANKKRTQRKTFRILNKFTELHRTFKDDYETFKELFSIDFLAVDNIGLLYPYQRAMLFELLLGRAENQKATFILFDNAQPDDSSKFIEIVGDEMFNFIRQQFQIVMLNSLEPFKSSNVIEL